MSDNPTTTSDSIRNTTVSQYQTSNTPHPSRYPSAVRQSSLSPSQSETIHHTLRPLPPQRAETSTTSVVHPTLSIQQQANVCIPSTTTPITQPSNTHSTMAAHTTSTSSPTSPDPIQQLATALQQSMTTAAAKPLRLANFTPPTFTGAASESLKNWLEEYTHYSNYMNWTEDQMVKAVPLILQGRAKQVYQDLSLDDRMKWSVIKQTMEKAFGIDASAQLLNFHTLNRVQQTNESVGSYAHDLLQRLQKANITDQQHIMSSFYMGLLPEIKAKVILMQSEDFTQLEKNASIVQQSLQANGRDSVNVIQTSPPTTSTSQQYQSSSPDSQTFFPSGQRSQAPFPHARNTYRNEMNMYSPPNDTQYGQRNIRQPYQQRSSQQGPFTTSSRPTRYQNYHKPPRPPSPYPRSMPRAPGPNTVPTSRGPVSAWCQRHNKTREDYEQTMKPPSTSPYCRNCDSYHPFGEHDNIRCYVCNQIGHIARNCTQNFH